MHSKSVAEDIVQEVFVRLARVDLSKIDSPVKYLYRCVRNAALDYAGHAYAAPLGGAERQ